ncbi:MAG TPA: glucoamylase family protein, partial [Bacillota bacterium]|nr:glucoamylase family protein [Bacillota bacterium]
MYHMELLDIEARGCFDYFFHEVNDDIYSQGHGLIRDRAPYSRDKSSIAATGFGLAAYVIGCERGWMDKRTAKSRINRTLDTLMDKAEHIKGFFYHFLSMETAKRYKSSEVSIIDTAIALCGAITAGEYFGGPIKEKAASLFRRVDWNWFRDKDNNRFYMGYTPEEGFSGWWDFYAEQLVMYILGAGSVTHPVSGDMFYSFDRRHDRLAGPAFIHSWFGSLFTHQYSHAWVDFRGMRDKEGVDWFENSVKATHANREYCIKMSRHFKTFHGDSWGLTACQGPLGYQGRYGAAPSAINDDEHMVDGTVPPAGAIGSIVFTPDQSMEALQYYYKNHSGLVGKYGLKDSYNLDVLPPWYSAGFIGIDKGISLVMAENYRTGLVWDLFMENENVSRGLELVGLARDVDQY